MCLQCAILRTNAVKGDPVEAFDAMVQEKLRSKSVFARLSFFRERQRKN